MIGYAVNTTSRSWRAILSTDDLLDGETFSETQPVLDMTYSQALSYLNALYSADRLKLCQAWLVAAVADGISETERKADVEAELNELDAQHAADIAELKTKHGVS